MSENTGSTAFVSSKEVINGVDSLRAYIDRYGFDEDFLKEFESRPQMLERIRELDRLKVKKISLIPVSKPFNEVKGHKEIYT